MTRPSLAARAYATLLALYPASYRARYATDMQATFARELDAARAAGWTHAAALAIGTAVDAVRFGLVERIEHARQDRRAHRTGATLMNLFAGDLRDGWRALRATPAVTLVAVLSLALGIGANTALFSILDSLVLKTLPVREPERLAILTDGSYTNPIWEAIRSRQDQIADGAFAWSATRLDLSTSTESEMVDGAWVSGRLFDILGVNAARGRMLSPGDDVRGGGVEGPTAVISYNLWQRRFGGSDDAIGKALFIERRAFTIVGVMPQRFFGPDVGRTIDVAIPIGAEPIIRGKESSLDARSNWWLEIMFRLRPGQTVDQATSQLRAMQPQIRAETTPQGWRGQEAANYLRDAFVLEEAASGRSPLRTTYTRPLTVVLTVVALVLLIACANIASLLLARAIARRHEFSVRLALGASRWRLARQLLVESLLLSLTGAVLGLLFAGWASRLLVAQMATLRFIPSLDLSLDWRVLGFTTLVTVVTALTFGLAPALGINSLTPNDALKERGRGTTAGRLALRSALVVVQVALSLTLVVAAGLFARTFVTLATRDPGFNSDSVLLVNVNAQKSNVDRPQRTAFFMRLRDAAAAVPGVARASAAFTSPLGAGGWNTEIAVPADSPLSRRDRMTWINTVTPGFFDVYGIKFVAGRDVSDTDRQGAPLVAVVNRAFAKRFLAPGNPVGQHFSDSGIPSGDGKTYEVVGLVEDVVYRSMRAEMMPTIFLPFAQWEGPGPGFSLAVRSAGVPPGALAKSILTALGQIDKDLAVSYHPLATQVSSTLVQERLLAVMSVFFGGLALLLAGLGLYGVTSYAVGSRRTEIGIRMALGAQPSRVVSMVLRRVAVLVTCGVAAGTILSAWAARFVETLLYGLEPRDPATVAVAGVLLFAVGALAAWLPARRAAKTDPTVVLRES